MSHHRQVGVLAHFEPLDVRATTHLPEDTADELVARMVAERISRKLIRMLPPKSVFRAEKRCRAVQSYIPERLGPQEVANCKFQQPLSANISTVPRTHYLPRRREKYGDWQLTTSLLPANQSA